MRGDHRQNQKFFYAVLTWYFRLLKCCYALLIEYGNHITTFLKRRGYFLKKINSETVRSCETWSESILFWGNNFLYVLGTIISCLKIHFSNRELRQVDNYHVRNESLVLKLEQPFAGFILLVPGKMPWLIERIKIYVKGRNI